ncbi:hypothetical protein PHMEG_00011717 [Phytophthora megakarya]|uniref:Uncharacterized protein n=1 Tax=Phytophthora megakarya TaxID=4795 RepID=A0A225WBZ9_9STRA|nr:hypothetical protein PHMEG_00011717 [Phytophthora megakarya]
MRADKYKQGNLDTGSKDLSNQIGHISLPDTEKGSTSVRVSESLPHTTKLLSKLSKASPASNENLENPVGPKKVMTDKPFISSRTSNVAALEAMKQQMAHDIQEQIATTRAALREMEVCSLSGKTLEEEEEELRQLQQQLAARSAEMDATMKESRTKLKELLNPATAAAFDENDEMESNQEPSIFDSTALVNELIARAEKSTHILYKKWTADRSRKVAQLASYRDHQAALNAQNSMKVFQQSLAEFRSER